MAALPAQQNEDAQLFATFNAELHSMVRQCVNTSAANIDDACADAWLALLRFVPSAGRRSVGGSWWSPSAPP